MLTTNTFRTLYWLLQQDIQVLQQLSKTWRVCCALPGCSVGTGLFVFLFNMKKCFLLSGSYRRRKVCTKKLQLWKTYTWYDLIFILYFLQINYIIFDYGFWLPLLTWKASLGGISYSVTVFIWTNHFIDRLLVFFFPILFVVHNLWININFIATFTWQVYHAHVLIIHLSLRLGQIKYVYE